MLRLRILFASLIVLVGAISCFAQVVTGLSSITNSNQNEKFSVSGVVVNAVSGEPIRRAMVTLFFNQQLATMTNSDGRFEFEGIPKSQVTLSAQKPGFFSEQELTQGGSQPPMVEVGPDAAPVTLRLTPEAVVFGRIIDTDGIPIQSVPVRTMTQRIQEGRKTWQQTMAASTDEDGRYRIYGLQPGEYFFSIGPGQMPALVTTGGDPLELGYPEVVYPGGGPKGSGSAMRINAGSQTEVSLMLHAEPFYTVSGSVGGVGPTSNAAVQMSSRSLNQEPQFGAPIDKETGTFQFPRVARGDYTLQAYGMDSAGKRLQGSVPLQVRGNVMGVHVELQPMLTFPIRVRTERTKASDSNDASGGGLVSRGRSHGIAQVRLVSMDDRGQQIFGMPEDPKNPQSSLVMRDVPPGNYRAEMLGSGEAGLYVASARLGSADLLKDSVELTADSHGEIEVVMRDDAPTLLIKSPILKTKSNVQIVVVPEEGESDAVGGMMWGYDLPVLIPKQLRPGTYTVLIFDDISNLEYANREALEPYLSRGVRVTLGANEQKTISPELIRRRGQ
jgi:hypothetical protein